MHEIDKNKEQSFYKSCEQAAKEAEERRELEKVYFRRGKWDARVWFSVAPEEDINYHEGIFPLEEMAIDGLFCYEEIEANSPLVPADEPANEYFYMVFESDDAFSYEKHYDCNSGHEFFIPNDLYRAWLRGWIATFRKLLSEREKKNQTE